MNFSLNMIEVLNMAIDNVNGNFNFFFLKRLLEAIMVESNLQTYEMDFSGLDAKRARDVFTGLPDYGKTPLNSTIRRQNDDEDQTQVDNKMELDPEDLGQMVLRKQMSLKNSKNKTEINEQIHKTANYGSLNIKMLQDLEKINIKTYSNSRLSVTDKISKTSLSQKSINNELSVPIELMNRINQIENGIQKMLEKIQKLESDINTNTFYPNSQDLTKKKPFIQSEATTKLITDKLQKHESDVNTNFRELHLKSRLSGSEEINVQSLNSVVGNKPPIFNGTPDSQQLSNRIDQVESIIRTLSHKTHEIETNTNLIHNMTQNTIHSTAHVDDDDDDEFEIDHVKSEQSLADQEDKFKKVMDFDVTMFQRIYTTQNLDGFVTIRNLRSLANDYTKKFQVLVDFMKIHKKHIIANESKILTLQKEKFDEKAYVEYKEKTKTVLRKIQNDVAEYIQKDPESSGRVVQFVKGGTCTMCAKNVLMKTTYEPSALPKKAFFPRPSIKAHLTYELDRIRKQHNSLPGTKDLNLLNTLCDCVPSARKCFQPNTARKKFEPLKNKLISRPTPLQKWILNKSPIQ